MPNISNRGRLMPSSPIRKLVPLAEEAGKRGCKVYKLNIGQPDILTSPNALQAIRNINASIIDYGHSAGNESLRRKFAEYYKKIGVDLIIRISSSQPVLQKRLH